MLNTRELLSLLNILPAIAHHSLSIYPLVADSPLDAPNYLTLNEAIESGQFRITEVSEGGMVSHLLAINETASRVLLLDGEELIGAKQNRILNLTVLVAPRNKTVIPVSCVEAGRWNQQSTAFRTVDRVQFARARAQKMTQVSRSLHSGNQARSDQRAVWNSIAAKSARMRAHSPTGAMAAIYESHQRALDDYLQAIQVVDGQIGAIFAIGSSIIGVELFNAPSTYRKLSKKLISSYALDAIECDNGSNTPNPDAPRIFLDLVKASRHQHFRVAGIGETVRLSGDEVSGAALEFNSACVHLAAFSRIVSDQERAAGDT
jgi:hypothetical protein